MIPSLMLCSYGAFVLLVFGLLYRTVLWLSTPAPLRIPLWPVPRGPVSAVFRVLGEALVFRSLLRENKALWVASLAFHYSLLLILVKHLRYLWPPPVPQWLVALQSAGIVPACIFIASLLYLLARRCSRAPLAYLSTPEDYLVLLYLAAIALTGILMKYCFQTDLLAVKFFLQSLLSLRAPSFDHNIIFPTVIFTVHYLLVCALAAYVPFGKLLHGAALFFSPPLTQAGAGKRHKNPWNSEEQR
ncbi:MAG: respiratory nitrate reductase subunit gamma [Candidatus Eremiobacteraeota bacterium]|nr:respiratory nitrate reductase subunit gamma [Candidatus Eremiobacteraeota bacterium]